MNRIVLFTAITLFQFAASAHNENVPGPHGGRTQMPANFHTEVVADKDGSIRVYLLDMEFKNPMVAESEVKAYFMSDGKKKTSLKCTATDGDHFLCKNNKPMKAGNLILKVKRGGTQASMDAKYELPLKPFDTKTEQNPTKTEDHSKHH